MLNRETDGAHFIKWDICKIKFRENYVLYMQYYSTTLHSPADRGERSKLTISEVLLYFLGSDLLWLTTMQKILLLKPNITSD